MPATTTVGLEIGQKAPSFTLPDQNGKNVSLKDFSGKWLVLYFYPKDDTPGCTKEACQFTDGIGELQKVNATVVGVSPDGMESHQAFIKKYDLKVTLLSDEDKKMMQDYAAYGEKLNYGKTITGVTRCTYIIDPRGNIAYRWKTVQADGHAAHVQAKLVELQAANNKK